MGRGTSFFIGGAIGVLIAAVITYLFEPAPDTYFDQRYQSRWDRALAEGKQAAAEHEALLQQQFANAKHPDHLRYPQ